MVVQPASNAVHLLVRQLATASQCRHTALTLPKKRDNGYSLADHTSRQPSSSTLPAQLRWLQGPAVLSDAAAAAACSGNCMPKPSSHTLLALLSVLLSWLQGPAVLSWPGRACWDCGAAAYSSSSSTQGCWLCRLGIFDWACCMHGAA